MQQEDPEQASALISKPVTQQNVNVFLLTETNAVEASVHLAQRGLFVTLINEKTSEPDIQYIELA